MSSCIPKENRDEPVTNKALNVLLNSIDAAIRFPGPQASGCVCCVTWSSYVRISTLYRPILEEADEKAGTNISPFGKHQQFRFLTWCLDLGLYWWNFGMSDFCDFVRSIVSPEYYGPTVRIALTIVREHCLCVTVVDAH